MGKIRDLFIAVEDFRGQLQNARRDDIAYVLDIAVCAYMDNETKARFLKDVESRQLLNSETI